MKKIISYLSLTLIAAFAVSLTALTPAVAGGPDVHKPDHKLAGWFVGVGTGYNVSDDEFTEQTQVPANVGLSNVHSTAATGIKGLIMAGYGWNVRRHFYIGLLALATIHSLSPIHAIASGYTFSRLGIESSYGLMLMPGIYLSHHTLFFFQLAAMSGLFTAWVHQSGFSNTEIYQHHVAGFLFGAGLQMLVWHGIALQLALNHTWYSNVQMSAGRTYFTHCPGNSQFEAALIFHFFG